MIFVIIFEIKNNYNNIIIGIVKKYVGTTFQRVHFHFSGKYKILNQLRFAYHVTDSGHGKYSNRVVTATNPEGGNSNHQKAKEPHGQVVVANTSNQIDSVHDLKLELLKLKTEKLTLTLDCCRAVSYRSDESVTDLR